MATSWLKSLKVAPNKSMPTVISDIIDYIKDPQKTDEGRLISSYACDSRVADEQFLLSKKEYNHITNRKQGRREVIAYHIRQSFKPGEVDAETANRIGYELAMSFTKGKHAFIVATHIDKAHIHNHIIFNSTALSHDRKFKDFWFSGKAVRRISDLLCLENGLSVIENPKPSKGKNYAKWLGNKKPSWQEKLRQKIDEVLPACSTFEEFLAALKAAGYMVNHKRKHISVLAPGQRQPTRINTLKGEHTEEAILRRIAAIRTVASSGGRATADHGAGIVSAHTNVSLLIDIQSKIQEGKGAGYEKWARIFNLREAAKTLLFLQENNIDNYDDLVKKASSASGGFSERSNKIKDIDKRLKEISEMQKQIGTYGKTRKTFDMYQASGWDKDFYESQRADITLHRAAKKFFNDLGFGKNKKLPKISELKQEYATLLAEKKKLYSGYRAEKENSRALIIAKNNADRILGIKPDAQKSGTREHNRSEARDI
jgi:type IV secretory pathway VirD2 relaxase